jgi:hypothetical protein
MSETGGAVENRSMEAKSENDEEKGGRGAESREQTESRPPWKLRDLRPEKDPMGAGNGTPPAPDVADR